MFGFPAYLMNKNSISIDELKEFVTNAAAVTFPYHVPVTFRGEVAAAAFRDGSVYNFVLNEEVRNEIRMSFVLIPTFAEHFVGRAKKDLTLCLMNLRLLKLPNLP